MSSVEFMRGIVHPNARTGAERAGRNPDELVFPMAATVSINADRELAQAASRASICRLFHPIPHPYYDLQLRQLGFSEFADKASELMPAGRLDEAMSWVPDEVVATMTVTGTLDDCIARVGDYNNLADEVILARTAQPDDSRSLTDYADFFELIRQTGANA